MSSTKLFLPNQKLVWDTREKHILDCFFAHGLVKEKSNIDEDGFFWLDVETIKTTSYDKRAFTTFQHHFSAKHYILHQDIFDALNNGSKIHMYWRKDSNSDWHIRGIDIFEIPETGISYPTFNKSLELISFDEYKKIR